MQRQGVDFIRYPDPYLMSLSMAYPAMSNFLNTLCIIPYTDPESRTSS